MAKEPRWVAQKLLLTSPPLFSSFIVIREAVARESSGFLFIFAEH